MKNWKLITQLLTIFVFLFTSQVCARFLAADPVRVVDQNGEINQKILYNPQGLNLYTYGLNNPYRFVDPDGRSPEFALSSTEYFALRADGIGADPYTWEGTNRTARYLQEEAIQQATLMVSLYGGSVLNNYKAMSRLKTLANKELKGGATAIGRALQKHSSRAGSWLEGLASGGNNAKNTATGNRLLAEIMQKGKVTTRMHKVEGEVTIIRTESGRGVWFNKDRFIGFLEKYTQKK